MSTATITNYFLVPAPGYYGDKARVLSAHAELKAARGAARQCPGLVVRVGKMEAGDRWLRAYEEIYPVAK